MERTVINFRMDKELKTNVEEICEEMGMSLSTAFTIFAKKIVRERRIPFAITATTDPFYSPKNMKRLKSSIEEMEKTDGTIHNIENLLNEEELYD